VINLNLSVQTFLYGVKYNMSQQSCYHITCTISTDISKQSQFIKHICRICLGAVIKSILTCFYFNNFIFNHNINNYITFII
ncbi:MAG: hypothetical protein EBR82_52625, partial [Caulobacteraceae bacterium]|nr:hypothetical protein [Caulobacteraceae bacterium]